jgi:hypothetical protein
MGALILTTVSHLNQQAVFQFQFRTGCKCASIRTAKFLKTTNSYGACTGALVLTLRTKKILCSGTWFTGLTYIDTSITDIGVPLPDIDVPLPDIGHFGLSSTYVHVHGQCRCQCVHVYVNVHVCVCVHVPAHVRVRPHVSVRPPVHVSFRVCERAHVGVHVRLSVSMQHGDMDIRHRHRHSASAWTCSIDM